MEHHSRSGNSDGPPSLRLPSPETHFGHRAARFRQLATGHSSLANFLALMADLADSQRRVAAGLAARFSADANPGRSPLGVAAWRPDAAWNDTLRHFVECLNGAGGPLAAIGDRLRQTDAVELGSLANRLLVTDLDQADMALAPFVAAALQTHWTVAASRLQSGTIGPSNPCYLCPVCGFLPVAGVLQTGGAVQGLRYLVCGLCGSQWHRPRIHCIHCGSSKDVAYYGIEGAVEAVKAEACAECNTYVKLLNREKDSGLDAFADDLATLSLDLLMAEEGYQRLGFNPLLIPGR